MLRAVRNRYGGVFVAGRELPVESADFHVALSAAVGAWMREGLQLAWLEIPAEEYLARDGIGPFNRRIVEAALAADPLLPVKLDDYMDGPDDYEIFMADTATTRL